MNYGVQECVRRYENQTVDITIIGDSELVLRQITGLTRCKSGRLDRHRRRTTRLLSSLARVTVRHTLRTGNKMADHLANVAMDTKTTQHATAVWTDIDTTVQTYLDNDASHAHRPITPRHDLRNDIQRAIREQEEVSITPKRKRTKSH